MCFRAGHGASGPGFGRFLGGKYALRPAEGTNEAGIRSNEAGSEAVPGVPWPGWAGKRPKVDDFRSNFFHTLEKTRKPFDCIGVALPTDSSSVSEMIGTYERIFTQQR